MERRAQRRLGARGADCARWRVRLALAGLLSWATGCVGPGMEPPGSTDNSPRVVKGSTDAGTAATSGSAATGGKAGAGAGGRGGTAGGAVLSGTGGSSGTGSPASDAGNAADAGAIDEDAGASH
jgi:hypothetical protein